uniref:Peptidase metallopeptidase domain-containing protein n=1 Tax=Meloidogyne enterolobii TaxID=390850 RepID=A0A6V7UBI7_MELEN|nr:unnamed protein product [Meloidogyne enterolobii]
MRRIFFSYLFKLKILFLILFCNYFSSSHSLSALISIPSLKINSKNLNKQHRVNKRFVLHSQRWNTCRLSWSFRDPYGLFPSDELFAQTKSVIADAVHLWSQVGNNDNKNGKRGFIKLTDLSPVTRISLMNVRRVADIDIFFAGYAHGDAESFDGRGGLVAHSAYPPLGIVHFDASEYWDLGGEKQKDSAMNNWNLRKTWKINRERRSSKKSKEEQQTVLDLRYVAVHEIGHALGLRHSTFRNSVMNRYYKMAYNSIQPSNKPLKLSKDDEAAIEELFGEMCNRN